MSSNSASLLARLQDPHRNEAAWARLLDLYSPRVYRACRRAGVPARDVGDVAQEVFHDVIAGIVGFRSDRPGDTFQGWLTRITQRRIADYWRFRHQTLEGEAVGGSDAGAWIANVPGPESSSENTPTLTDPNEPEEDDFELRLRALQLIETRFAYRTWRACWLVVVERRPVEAVAEHLGMTANAVRIAKSRVLACLWSEFGAMLNERLATG